MSTSPGPYDLCYGGNEPRDDDAMGRYEQDPDNQCLNQGNSGSRKTLSLESLPIGISSLVGSGSGNTGYSDGGSDNSGFGDSGDGDLSDGGTGDGYSGDGDLGDVVSGDGGYNDNTEYPSRKKRDIPEANNTEFEEELEPRIYRTNGASMTLGFSFLLDPVLNDEFKNEYDEYLSSSFFQGFKVNWFGGIKYNQYGIFRFLCILHMSSQR